jgi:hypothetical protein
VGRDNHRALTLEGLEVPPQAQLYVAIEAAERLVKEQKAPVSQEGTRQGKPMLLACR